MQSFDIIRTSVIKPSFRVDKCKGKFDLNQESITEHFKGELNIPENWNVGLIVGNSGTGKTTIAKELFGKNYIVQFEYGNKPVIDEMPENVTVDQIAKAFNSVGFSSPPSWLKPYHVLSNGEKMRVDLARAILSNQSFSFDEFTSVVDRNVAKVTSFAIQKAIRKQGKQFIAISPHFDIIDWLLPNWIFNTNTMTFESFEGQKKNRPIINCQIRVITKTVEKESVWRELGKYHYLNHTFSKSATMYALYIDDLIIGFIMVLHFPHFSAKNIKQGHRTVIRPDYQGIGLGNFLIDWVAKYLIKQGFRYIATTSSPSIIEYRKNRKEWKCTHIGRTTAYGKTGTFKRSKAVSSNRITTSWEYILNEK